MKRTKKYTAILVIALVAVFTTTAAAVTGEAFAAEKPGLRSSLFSFEQGEALEKLEAEKSPSLHRSGYRIHSGRAGAMQRRQQQQQKRHGYCNS